MLKEYILFWIAQTLVGVGAGIVLLSLAGVGWGVVWLLAMRHSKKNRKGGNNG